MDECVCLLSPRFLKPSLTLPYRCDLTEVITVLDGFKFIGTMQICVSRMLQESTIFLGLLAVLGLGFAQAMYALDASDGQTGHGALVVHQLVQALLQ